MEQVALGMDGEWTPEIERHAAECQECSALLADRELLREAPTIPEAAVAEVRARVMKQVAPSRSQMWLAAAAVFVAAAGITWWVLRPAEVQHMEVAVSAPAAPQLMPVSASPATQRVRRAIRSKPANGQATLAMALREAMGPQTAPPVSGSGSVLVAVQTEDPEVMIVLVDEAKGDGE
jgi:hypothetical protein